MKGIYKGVKYTLSQFFVVKEPELEIGGPTDVKHVSHIGWDGASGGNPSWMSQYQTGPDFASTSIGSTWSSSQAGTDLGEPPQQRPQSASTTCKDIPQPELPPVKKKMTRKKCKASSCPASAGSDSMRPSRFAKSKAKFVEENSEQNNIEVA